MNSHEFRRVFPDAVTGDARFRTAFAQQLRRLAHEEPLAVAATPWPRPLPESAGA